MNTTEQQARKQQSSQRSKNTTKQKSNPTQQTNCNPIKQRTQDYTVAALAKEWVKGRLHFLPDVMPSAKDGKKPIMLRPWGDDADVDEDEDHAALETCFMALCNLCGRWRTIPKRTRSRFKGKKATFHCAHSPWAEDCSTPLTELEEASRKVPPGLRRGGTPAHRLTHTSTSPPPERVVRVASTSRPSTIPEGVAAERAAERAAADPPPKRSRAGRLLTPKPL